MNRLFEGDPSPYLTVDLGSSVGYVEPIKTGALCVTCHGEHVAPPVQKVLAELYPDDRATGFKVGSFRGVFWAEVVPGFE